MWKTIGSLAVVGVLLASPAAARPPVPDRSQEELIEEILELQRRIEELLAKLPPAVREDLRRRLAEVEAVTPEAAGEEPAAAASPPPASTETVAAEPARVDPPLAAPPPTPWSAPRRRPPRERCNTLLPLDENGDGKISSADRYWRHLYVWTDKGGDGRMQEGEIESVYDRRVREIDVALETFSRARGGLGEIRVADRVVLDLRGDGFSERSRRDDGVLLLDAGAVRRGDGPALLGPEGETLDGYQPFRAGLEIRLPGGEVVALSCPRARAAGD